MRLICPNCGAQYEVPDGVVPQEGRDVQCSNCGNTWFQAHPDNDQALTDELNPPQVDEPDQSEWSGAEDVEDDVDAEEDKASTETSETQTDTPDWDKPDADEEEWQGFDEPTGSEATPESVENFEDEASDDEPSTTDHTDDQDNEQDQSQSHDEAEGSDDTVNEIEHTDHSDETADEATDDDPDSAPVETAKARELDPSVADILQQEAEFEANARASDSSLESQPDLGLDEAAGDVDQRAREANERMARLRGDTPLEESVAATVAASSRRDLLPDIDEINSTLRSTSDRKSGITEEFYDEDFETPRKSGRFRRGFWMIVLAALVLFLLYIFAPQIIKALPALEGVMTSYVAMVDQLRVWLDGRVQSGLQWLDTKASTSGE